MWRAPARCCRSPLSRADEMGCPPGSTRRAGLPGSARSEAEGDPVKSLPCPAIVCLAANLAPAPCTCTLPRLHCNALYLAWAPVHALLDGGRKLIVCCLCRQ